MATGIGIGVPTMSGVSRAVGDYAVGAGSGLVYGLATSLFGNGFIGSVVAAGIAGAVVKGDRGSVVATIAGFQAFSGGLGAASPAAQSPAFDVM